MIRVAGGGHRRSRHCTRRSSATSPIGARTVELGAGTCTGAWGDAHHVQLRRARQKKFPPAVDRNRIRRQVREAFRIHQGLLAGLEAPLALMVLYTAAEALPFSDIEGAMVRLLKKIGKQVVKEG